jgi:hypothetical protein
VRLRQCAGIDAMADNDYIAAQDVHDDCLRVEWEKAMWSVHEMYLVIFTMTSKIASVARVIVSIGTVHFERPSARYQESWPVQVFRDQQDQKSIESIDIREVRTVMN